MRVGHVNRREDPDGSETVWAEVQDGDRRQEVRYRVRGARTAAGADLFVPVTLLPAMRAGAALEFDDPVSPRLRTATSDVQTLVRGWDHSLSEVALTAAGASPAARPGGVGCFFSGGVDSFYTVLKHREEITHLIFVHGFDMELRATRLRERVADALRLAAAELGKPLVEVETNLRAFSDGYVRWSEEYDGSALASVALLLSGELGKVYVPASFSDAFLIPWGTHPHLDPLWSTETTEIVHDGNESGRPRKVARIAKSDVALRWLRVCWENRDQAYNCGRCEKCLRTMVNLRIAGALDRCSTFARPLDLRAVRGVVIPDECARIFVEENLAACRAAGDDPELERALEACLAAHPSRLRALLAEGDLRRRGLRKLRRSLGMPTHNWEFVASKGQ